MLPFLLPSASLARATPQLARQLQSIIKSRHSGPCQRCASNVAGRASRAGSEQEDLGESDDPPNVHSHRGRQTPFSHFFDRRVPVTPSIQEPRSGDSKASYDITAASRQATTALRRAVSSGSSTEIVDSYDNLVRTYHKHLQDVTSSSSKLLAPSEVGFPLRKDDIQNAIETLLLNARKQGPIPPQIAEACRRMFQDLSRLFAFKIAANDLHRQLYCVSRSTDVDQVTAFRELRESYPDWKVAPFRWGMIISPLARRGCYDQAIDVWQEMMEAGVQSDVRLRETMVNLCLESQDTPARARLEGLAQGADETAFHTCIVVVEGLCNFAARVLEVDEELLLRLRTHASHLRGLLESRAPDEASTAARAALLRFEAVDAGLTQAPETASRANEPQSPDQRAIEELLLGLHGDELNSVQSSDEAVELLDRVLAATDKGRNIHPDNQCYHLLMLGLLNTRGSDIHAIPAEDAEDGATPSRALPSPNQVREAQLLYDHARAIGVSPTTQLVAPLLRAYCEAFIPSISAATKLVSDMLDHRAVRKATNEVPSRNTDRVGMDVIGPVLDACVRTRDVAAARGLLSRLQSARIAIDVDDKALLIRPLVGMASSWSEAFEIYRALSRLPISSTGESTGLNTRGYTELRRSLFGLCFTEDRGRGERVMLAAPPEDLLGVLQDMRADGYPPTCAVYTAVLDYYSKTQPPSAAGVGATHAMIKWDEKLEPDLPLVNALMNAYNRIDEPTIVLAIWESLLATRQEIDAVTLTVFFDTAGRHGLLTLARKVVGTVQRAEHEAKERGAKRRTPMNKGAWDAWLECLARCGRLEEAIEVAFGEMRTTLLRQAIEWHDLDQDGDAAGTVAEILVRSMQAPVRDRNGHIVGPDAKTFGTLLKFAARERDRRQRRRTGRDSPIWHTLRTRLREELSWLYPQVRHIGESTQA
ncbi:hypothetical protein PANT_9c00386 [Moesziomyces antarcticus T-34]|uniref:Uncharacterized protein n=1 Tax=Pseudozyma antarctica (strain T-34) TaxID=1151754 RepID=M9MCY2_PSEA3|nr:hypothetical protein PANT_9c00386 [Moesziomyces antarcticus T-34]